MSSIMAKHKELGGKGLGIATAHRFEDEPSSMVHEQLARLIFAESHIPMKGERILDFGCGSGYSAYYVSERRSPKLVVGLDVLEECIAYCKQHYSSPKTEYHVQDCCIHNPEFGVFDVVISCEVVEHVEDQRLFLKTLVKYLKSSGVAFISTPNRGLFSLTKEKSFMNKTHKKELFFDEFEKLLNTHFSDCKIYSQIHKSNWHSAYVDNLCVSNFIYALRHEYFGNTILGRIASRIARFLYVRILPKMKSKDYPDIRHRRYTDFEFVEGFDNRAVWFVSVCSDPIAVQG